MFVFHAYTTLLKLAEAWAGELELLAAADKWSLKIAVIRPGKSTVVVGQGKAQIWVLNEDSHYEPLACNTDQS